MIVLHKITSCWNIIFRDGHLDTSGTNVSDWYILDKYTGIWMLSGIPQCTAKWVPKIPPVHPVHWVSFLLVMKHCILWVSWFVLGLSQILGIHINFDSQVLYQHRFYICQAFNSIFIWFGLDNSLLWQCVGYIFVALHLPFCPTIL